MNLSRKISDGLNDKLIQDYSDRWVGLRFKLIQTQIDKWRFKYLVEHQINKGLK